MKNHFLTSLCIISAAFAVPATAGQPRARAPVPEGFLILLQTKLTQVDLDGDGDDDVFRKYDANGDLLWMQMKAPGTSPVLTYEFVRQELPERVVWKESIGSQVIREVVSSLKGRRVIEHMETWAVAGAGRMDRRSVKRYRGLKAEVSVYRLEAGQWKLESRSVEDTIRLEDPPALGDYLDCIEADRGPLAARADCATHLTAVLDVRGFDYEQYTDLTCTRNDVLYLPNGFRIDLASCGSRGPAANLSSSERRAVVDSLTAAANYAAGSNCMGCLNLLNPGLAGRYLASVVAKRPILRCGSGVDVRADLCATAGDAAAIDACVVQERARMYRTGGFYNSSRENEIFLTGQDPVTNASLRDPDAYAGGLNGAVGETVCHEMIHSCGYSGHPNHNHPHYGDPVYGCNALCSGNSRDVTEEGCLACLTEPSNPTSPARTATYYSRRQLLARATSAQEGNCSQFPPQAVVQPLARARRLSNLVEACEREVSAFHASPALGAVLPSCEALEGQPEFGTMTTSGSTSTCDGLCCCSALNEKYGESEGCTGGTGRAAQFSQSFENCINEYRYKAGELMNDAYRLGSATGGRLDQALTFAAGLNGPVVGPGEGGARYSINLFRNNSPRTLATLETDNLFIALNAFCGQIDPPGTALGADHARIVAMRTAFGAGVGERFIGLPSLSMGGSAVPAPILANDYESYTAENTATQAGNYCRLYRAPAVRTPLRRALIEGFQSTY